MGRAGCRPAVPLPLLRRRGRNRPARDDLVPWRLRRGRNSTTSSPATTHARASCCGSSATRSPTSAPCGPSASASASPTRSTWRGCSTRPASPPARSADRRLARNGTQALADLRARRRQHPVRGRPVQRRPRHPRHRHDPVPAADRERDDLPPATGPRATSNDGQGGPHRSRLRRVPPQGVPVRPASCGRSQATHARRRATGPRRASPSCRPVAPIEMDRQAQTLVLENIRSQIANRWQQIVAELRRHMATQDLGGFLEESGIELSDILRRGSHSWTGSGETPVSPPRPDPSERRRCSNVCAHLPMSTIATERWPSPTLDDDAPDTTNCPTPNSDWPACSSTRCGRTAVAQSA